MANELLIEKQTGGYFKFTLNNDSANAITSIQNDLLAVGTQLHFKTGNGANIIKEQFIYPEDVTIIAGGTFTFTTVAQVWDKLIDIDYFAWLGGGGTGGVDRFDDLLDTFSYTGNAGKAVVVDGAELRLVPITLYNKRLFTELEDTPSSLVPNKMLVVNSAGTAVVLQDQPEAPEELLNSVGYFDYEDLITQTVPLTATSGVAKKLTNDTEGLNTNTDQNPYGVSFVWDFVDNQFNFSELSIGDTIDIRIHIAVTTTTSNQKVEIKSRFGIGSASQFDTVIYDNVFKSSGVHEISFVAPFYMGSLDIINNPAELYLTTDANATIRVYGWYVRILRKNINIITVDYTVPDATTLAKGIVRLAGDLGGTANNPTVPELANKVPNTRTVSTTSPLLGGGALSSDLTLSIQQANSVDSGFLSNVDWNTFNNKQPLIAHLEFDNTKKTVWNYGNGTINGNTSFGQDAFQVNTTGIFNTAYGNGALSQNTTGANNTAVGWRALRLNTTGSSNTVVGYDGLSSNTTGGQNTAIGFNSLKNNTTGGQNIAIGTFSLISNTTGDRNLAIGYFAGRSTSAGIADNISSNHSIFIGIDTKALANGQDNQIVIGFEAIGAGSNTVTIGNTDITTTRLRGAVQGGSFVRDGGTSSQFLKADGSVDSTSYQPLISHLEFNNTDLTVWNNGKGNIATNTSFGEYSLSSNTTGSRNTAIGFYSLESNTTGNDNTAIGYYTLRDNETGSNNTAIGDVSLNSNTTGSNNTAIGVSTLQLNTTGVSNTAIGSASVQLNTTGVNNTGVGNRSLNSNTTGNSNSAFGDNSLVNNTTGSNNTAIGNFAGHVIPNGNPNQTGSDSIFIGVDTRPLANGQSNQIVIGNNAIGHGSNTVTLGNSSIVTTILRGNVGIGTTSTSEKLEVNGSVLLRSAGAIKFNRADNLIFTQLYDAGAYFALDNRNGNGFDFQSAGTSQMRITSDGTLLVNSQTANGYGGVSPKLEVYGSSVISTDGDGGTLGLLANTNTAGGGGALVLGGTTTSFYATWGRIRAPKDNATSGNYAGGLAFDTRLNGSTFAERMRITSDGHALFGTTTTSWTNTAGTYIFYQSAFNVTRNDAEASNLNRLNSNGDILTFRRDGTQVGSVSVTTTLTSYNVTSDYRLKQDFKPFNGLDLVSKIKVYDYAWKADNSRMNGVIAHELQKVVPYAVTGEKDAEQMQQVDYSKLVPILVQAIQDLQQKINKLENK